MIDRKHVQLKAFGAGKSLRTRLNSSHCVTWCSTPSSKIYWLVDVQLVLIVLLLPHSFRSLLLVLARKSLKILDLRLKSCQYESDRRCGRACQADSTSQSRLRFSSDFGAIGKTVGGMLNYSLL